MKTFTDRWEAHTEANKIKIEVGDKVKVGYTTCTIAEIYYKDVYVECGHPNFKEAKDRDLYYIFYEVEFRDTNGTYRNWKSSFDGGELIHK